MPEFKLKPPGVREFSTDFREGCPAISVVIPLYNTEKYIGECLESLLAQSFKNFEIVIVNDCSTDASVEIVQSYLPKFDGRLTLAHTETNSGGASLPRNKAVKLAQGKYIFFADADDMLTSTALEEMFKLAEIHGAEVIYCERYMDLIDNATNSRVTSQQSGKLVDKPIFQSEDLKERLKDILQRDIWGAPWSKFVRRDFLIENELFFPNVFPCEDYLWTLTLYFYAKKFLRVPNVTYLWRQTKNSTTRREKTPQQNIPYWLNPVIFGLKWLDRQITRIDFFKDNFQYRYDLLDFVVIKIFGLYFHSTLKLPPFAVCETIEKEFGKNLGEFDMLIPILFTAYAKQQKIMLTNQVQFADFAKKAQKRIAELETELKTLKEKSQQNPADRFAFKADKYSAFNVT